MTASLLPEGKQSFENSAGAPLVGGKLYTYDAGTNNPKVTYQDSAGTVPNTNPVVMDARGEAVIFWNGVYKVVLKDAMDNLIWTVDNVATPETAGSSAALAANLLSTASGKGAGLVGYLRASVYPDDTVGEKLHYTEYDLVGDGDADPTGVAYCDAALDAAFALGVGTIIIPEGSFRFANPHKVPSYTKIKGRGINTILIKDTANTVNVTDPTTGLTTNNVNCLFYPDPAYVANPDDPTGVDAACQVHVERVRYRYTGAFTVNSCFVFTTQLGRSRFSELYVAGCDWAIWALILYTTLLDRIMLRGCRIDTGTSLTVVSGGGYKYNAAGSVYGWKLNNIVYSVLQGVFTENWQTAFRFDNCDLALIGVGGEVNTGVGVVGQFLDIGDNNNLVLLNTNPIVKPAGASGAIVSVSGINNKLRFLGGKWNTNPGQAAVYDLYIAAGGNTLWFEDTAFYSGAQPIINCNGALNRNDANVYVRAGDTVTRYTTNSVATPLLASASSVLDSSTANEIGNRKTSGGGAFDSILDSWKANGADKFYVKKLGSSGGSSVSGAAAGGVDLLLDSGSGDACFGTLGSGATRFIGNGGRVVLNFNLFPGADNAQTLGSASNRWSVVYAATGAINTSDERAKQDIEDIPTEWLRAWGEVKWQRFRFKDAIRAKDDGARWHVGLIAQRVRDVFASHGLDATQIGLLCHDTWEAQPEVLDEHGVVLTPATLAGELWGIRYEEALAMECAYLRWKAGI